MSALLSWQVAAARAREMRALEAAAAARPAFRLRQYRRPRAPIHAQPSPR
jgi:hypothetical protein